MAEELSPALRAALKARQADRTAEAQGVRVEATGYATPPDDEAEGAWQAAIAPATEVEGIPFDTVPAADHAALMERYGVALATIAEQAERLRKLEQG